jgi:hypothetical protein
LASTGGYDDSFPFSYVEDVGTSQETPMGPTAYYGHSFTFLYVDDVRTPQETLIWACMAVTGIALLLYM